MANKLGVINVELFRPGSDQPAITGTDMVLHIDGRFSMETAKRIIIANVMHYNSKNQSAPLEWRGTVYLLRGRYRSITL
jgi:hypothetical protein